MAQGSEEPPFLKVGTEVSAKYRGAFCEASIKAIKKHVKCKIQYKDSTTATHTDDVVKGDLKVGSNVEVKSLDGRIMDGVITKLTDASVYTVVFDDGDERTLRRSSLCLKGERHFNESETLDHLPLTDPENFGTPVIQNGKKRKKRRPNNQQNTSIDEAGSEKEDNTPVPAKKKCLFNEGIVGKVVVVERGTRRKSHWFPALGVSPSPENMSYIKTKDLCLARSFKDGNYHVVSIRDTKEFAKDQDPVGAALRTDNRASKPAIERAIAYMETGRVPSIWEGNKSEVITHDEVDDESKRSGLRTNKTTASSDDENEVTSEDADKEPFMEKLQSFMCEKGTPITRSPILGNQDLDLHKLYMLVIEAGGMDEVTKKQEWRSIYSKMGIAIMPPSASHHIKMAYKKYLYPYETHETSTSTCGLGKESDEEIPAEVSMTKKEKSLNGRTRHERNSKSLTRQGTAEKSEKPLPDKRSKQVSSEKVDAQEKSISPVKVASSNKSRRSSTPNKPTTSKQSSTTPTIPPDKPLVPNKLSLSSTFTAPPSKQVTTPIGKSTARSVALSKAVTPDTSKELIPMSDKTEIKGENENLKEMKVEVENVLKQDEEHVVEERSFKQEDSLESDIDVDENVTSPESELAVDVVNSPGCMSDTSESRSDSRSEGANEEANDCIVGDKIQVKYGRGRNRRLYEAKIVTVDPDAEEGLLYLIHYTGWNIRYDEWISPDRVLGKSDKLSKRKGAGMKEFQRSKIPPKPIGKQYMRSHIKRGTKSPSPASPSPASPNSKPGETKAANNGHKASQRDSPLLQITEPAKPAVRSSPPSRRTRSERNSISSVTNGLDEAVKSPLPKRRQKSVTPEPLDISKHQLDHTKETSTSDSSVTEGSEVIPVCNHETEHLKNIEKQPSNEEISQESTTDIDLLCNIKNELKTDVLEKSNDQNNLHYSKLRAWSTLPNGLTSYSSSDSGSPGNSEHDTEPAAKKIQLAKEKDIANEDIRNLLSTKVECKSPIAAPHSEGSCSSDEQLVCLSADEDDRKMSMQAKTENNLDLSANCLSGTEVGKGESPSSIGKDENKCEKKDGDQRSKRNRKKRERKRQRHQSVNDNNSDGPGSPACSPSSKASPSRPKITFNAELESIKSMEDGSERIRLLQMKINEMRKAYGSLKAEVATIDRRRKKLKKKREENAGSSSHESNSKSSPSHCVSPSPAPVECR